MSALKDAPTAPAPQKATRMMDVLTLVLIQGDLRHS